MQSHFVYVWFFFSVFERKQNQNHKEYKKSIFEWNRVNNFWLIRINWVIAVFGAWSIYSYSTNSTLNEQFKYDRCDRCKCKPAFSATETHSHTHTQTHKHIEIYTHSIEAIDTPNLFDFSWFPNGFCQNLFKLLTHGAWCECFRAYIIWFFLISNRIPLLSNLNLYFIFIFIFCLFLYR